MEPTGPFERLQGVTVVREGAGAVLPTGSAESETFARVYTAQYATLVRLAYVTTGSGPAAEDVVQDAFTDLYRRFEAIAEPVPYLRRAVVSRCTSWVRRRALERRHARRDHLPRAVVPLGPDGAAVRAAMVRLNPRQRAAVFLRYYLDLSEAEIAETLGCRPGTVKSLLHRGLAELRRHLDD